MKINGQRVRELRVNMGLSQKQLADVVGLHQAGVDAIEWDRRSPAGALRSTSIEKFAKLVVALGTTADDLLVFDKEESETIRNAINNLVFHGEKRIKRMVLRKHLNYIRKQLAELKPEPAHA